MWNKIDEPLKKALALNVDARAAFLERLQNESPEIHRHVEGLLRQHEEFETEPHFFAMEKEPLHILDAAVRQRELPSPSREDAAPIPQRAGRYRIVEQIASGGQGAVLRAEDTDFGRTLAVKIMLPKVATNPRALQLFLREARITGQLQHPGIPPIHELGELDDGLPFFAMKLIEGSTLAELLKQRKYSSQDLPRFIHIFEQVCQTIAYSHSRGIIHRDLKPHNIMVGAFGEVQVMDWGLAKRMKDEGGRMKPEKNHPSAFTLHPSHETRAGTAMGTPAYMAPEQARGEIDQIDARSDVFGLAAILCQILTGRPPFTGETVGEIMQRASRGDLSEILERLKESSADAELIVLTKRCLAPDMKDRPRDGGEVADAVAAYQDSVQEKLRQAELHNVRALEQRKRQRWIMTAMAAGFLLLVGAATAAYLLQMQHAQRLTERQIRHAQTEANIRSLVEKVDDNIDKLDEDLRKPRGVFRLLTSAADWNRRLESTATLLAQAENLQNDTEISVDDWLSRQIVSVAKRLEQHEADHVLAVRLNKIRHDRMVWVDKKFNYAAALRGYPATFAKAKYPVMTGNPEKVAAGIRKSTISELLVAALDDWSFSSFKEKYDDYERLMQIARFADGDVQGGQLRNPALWREPTRLAKLTNAILKDPKKFAALSPELLTLVGSLLPAGSEEREIWFRQGQALHPRDFWLGFGFASALANSKKHIESAVAYRIALAIMPESAAAYNNWGLALADQKKYAEAIAKYSKASQLDPKLTYAYVNWGGALADQKKYTAAIAKYEKAAAVDPNYANAYVAWGNVLNHQNKYVEAAAIYEKATAVDPKLAAAYFNWADTLVKQNRHAEAVAKYAKATALDPKHAEAYYNWGNTLVDQKKYAEAVAKYAKATLHRPKFAKAFANWGAALAEQKKYAEAIPKYEKATALDPDDIRAYIGWGNALASQKKYAEAAAKFAKAIALDPKHADAYCNWGAALADQKKYAEAVAKYAKATILDPKHAGAYCNWGAVLADQKKYAEAVGKFAEATAVDPQHAKTYFNWGLTLAEQNKYAEAAVKYEKAAALDPKDDEIYYNWGNALAARKRYAEAAAKFARATALDPNNAEAFVNWGVALANQKNYAEAGPKFEKAAAVASKLAKAYYNWGNALAAQNKYTAAIAKYAKATALDLKNANAYNNWGKAHYEQKEYAEAAAKYAKAIALDPKHATAYWNWSLVLHKQGRFANAMAALTQCQNLLQPRHPLRGMVQRQLHACRQLQELEKKLPAAFESGNSNPAEQLQLANLCQRYLKRYRDAATLYASAFLADEKAANDFEKQHRFNAASAAALGAAAKGKHATKINAEEKAKLRKQALDWLMAELDLYRKLLMVKPHVAVIVQERLANCQEDEDLATVRDAKQLAAMPEAERHTWQELWADVERLRKTARGSYTEQEIEGRMTGAKPEQTHDFKLTAKKVYVIDMQSKQFDTLLRIADADGKVLAENDDIAPGKNLNSRITFTPKTTSAYKLTATSYQGKGVGEYKIFIREFSHRKRTAVIKNPPPKKDKPKPPPKAGTNDITGKLTADDLLDTFPQTKKSHHKSHEIKLDAGKVYQIDLTGDFDTFLRLEDADTKALLANDDVTPPRSLNSRLVFAPAKSGKYRLIVTSFKGGVTGKYRLKIRQVEKAGNAGIVNSKLEKSKQTIKGKFIKLHKIQLKAGTPYTIDLGSKKFDPSLLLLDPKGRAVAGNDDIAPGNKAVARIDFTPAQTGSYIIVVTSGRPAGMGEYTLRIQGYRVAN